MASKRGMTRLDVARAVAADRNATWLVLFASALQGAALAMRKGPKRPREAVDLVANAEAVADHALDVLKRRNPEAFK